MYCFISVTQKLFCKYFRHPSLVEAYQSVLTVDGISGFEDFKSKHESYSLAGMDTNPFVITYILLD